jgi:gliding motility-associated-like protein
MMKIFSTIIFVLSLNICVAQECTTLGQTPTSAFPLCGTAVFTQNTVPICSSVSLFVPGCSGSGGANYENKNPFWYQFTCYQSGSLGFVITPNNLNDDYDWQLYDITGKNPEDVYTDPSLVVTGNWSGSYGTTGAAAGGVNYIQCASNPDANEPRFSSMPNLIQGHEYLLLVSHYTDTQSGYSISFGGGTASIIDPLPPAPELADAICDGTSITLTLNKKMKCNSLTATGSEFFIEPAVATVVSATGNGCTIGFGLRSVTLQLSNALPPGTYTVKVRNGTDGNTLLDNCDRSLLEGASITLTIVPLAPTPLDSLTKPLCAPQKLELVFRKPIRCSSIAPNGSDFSISGSYPVTITGATGECNNGVTSKIIISLSAPLQTAGTFVLSLGIGTDGGSITDECGQVTPTGQSIPFSVKDTVNADFTTRIALGCVTDTVKYFHNGANGVNSWAWTFDNTINSNLQYPTQYYTVFGDKEAQLIVSNGTCTDTSKKAIFLRNTLRAAFEANEFVCPNDKAIFKNQSIGNMVSWQWDFGNGNSSSLYNPPPQTYMPSPSNINYDVPVRLIIKDDIGCYDTASRKVFIIWNCTIAIPSAFTPNSDGINDFLYPLNAYKAKDLQFSVYNRLGQRVFLSENWLNRWNGKFKGQDADTGTYVYILQYTHSDTGKRIFQKGSVLLIR